MSQQTVTVTETIESATIKADGFTEILSRQIIKDADGNVLCNQMKRFTEETANIKTAIDPLLKAKVDAV